MKSIFDKVSVACSKLTTRQYSTSFSLGIYFLDKKMRPHIYAIYGFVRFADEIVDSFEGYNKAYLLEKFKNDTQEAIEQKISLNPILNAFQAVVHQYGIEQELIDTFLNSMEMDLTKKTYAKHQYQEYILGSAEVVGLMCLRVFSNGNHELYTQLKPYAMRLGAAFQKVNFLRDVKSDYEQLGRNYFPEVSLANFSIIEKHQIETEIAEDFKQALIGIKLLPSSSIRGVYLAYIYYQQLFDKIRLLSPSQILKQRIRISNGLKFQLMLNSIVKHELKLI